MISESTADHIIINFYVKINHIYHIKIFCVCRCGIGGIPSILFVFKILGVPIFIDLAFLSYLTSTFHIYDLSKTIKILDKPDHLDKEYLKDHDFFAVSIYGLHAWAERPTNTWSDPDSNPSSTSSKRRTLEDSAIYRSGSLGLGRNFHLNIRHTLSPGTHSWMSAQRFSGFSDSGRGATALGCLSDSWGYASSSSSASAEPASKSELQHGNMLQSASSACIKYYATLCHRHRPDDTLCI